ncbi:MAG: MATE family efflux transporter [Lactobacillales bacterium]|jgi:putative MATE family efflux protein|nr:MATE family efflux transporter [Lactobacillales bacterium]
MRLKENKIIQLALPNTIENILQTSVGFVDSLMIAKIGLVAVTAVGIANGLLAIYLAVFIALGVGTSSLIARKLGEKNRQGATDIAAQSVIVALIVGLLFGVATLIFGKSMLLAMGAKAEIVDIGMQFFLCVGGFSIFMSLLTILGAILRATGDTRTPMNVSFLVNIFNILLDFVLIFGFGPIPALGVIGAGLGTTIARAIGCFLLWRKVQQSKLAFPIHKLFVRQNYRSLISLSLPAAIERLMMRTGDVAVFVFIVEMGTKVFAANTIAENISSFTYMPGFGLATACATLVGNAIGEKDYKKAHRIAYQSILYGAISMSFLGLILWVGCPWFAQLFTNDTFAISKILVALRIDAFIQPVVAFTLIITAALQGLGDTKTPMISTTIGMWVIRVILVYFLGITCKLNIAGVWIATGIDNVVRSIYMNFMFKRDLRRLKKGE